jgi:hypothetical protein
VKLTLESTEQLVELNGLETRIWLGRTARGLPVLAFIARIAVEDDAAAGFEDELVGMADSKPALVLVPRRMML